MRSSAPILSLSTDVERFRLVLRANGWSDFSRRIEKLRELQITDVRTIEIELPLSACGFAIGIELPLHFNYGELRR